jgi:hypothetical protein
MVEVSEFGSNDNDPASMPVLDRELPPDELLPAPRNVKAVQRLSLVWICGDETHS